MKLIFVEEKEWELYIFPNLPYMSAILVFQDFFFGLIIVKKNCQLVREVYATDT